MTEVLAVADLTADPKVRAFPLGSYDRKPQRTISYEWPVREDGDETIVVDLSCFHMRGHYVATLNNVRRSANMWSSLPMSATTLVTEPCARYSKPKFAAFAANALAQLRVSAGENEAILDYLRGEHAPPR